MGFNDLNSDADVRACSAATLSPRKYPFTASAAGTNWRLTGSPRVMSGGLSSDYVVAVFVADVATKNFAPIRRDGTRKFGFSARNGSPIGHLEHEFPVDGRPE